MWVHCALRIRAILLCVAVIVCFASPALAEDNDSFYYDVLIVDNDDATANLQRAAGTGYDAFVSELGNQRGSVRSAATFVRNDFGSSIGVTNGHIIVVCFDKSIQEDPYNVKGGVLARSAVCSIGGLAMRRGTSDSGQTSTQLSNDFQIFATSGFISIQQSRVVNELNLRHGETASLIANKLGTDGGPLPTFYFKVIRRWEWPGWSGVQVPVAAYGGVTGKDGIAFSLLAPALSWGRQLNFDSDSFRHVGFGILAAAAFLESPASGAKAPVPSTTTDAVMEKPAFTLKRLAIGGYVDMSGYVWLGLGGRFDFTEAHDHQFVLFMVVGPDTLSKIMSSSH